MPILLSFQSYVIATHSQGKILGASFGPQSFGWPLVRLLKPSRFNIGGLGGVRCFGLSREVTRHGVVATDALGQNEGVTIELLCE